MKGEIFLKKREEIPAGPHLCVEGNAYQEPMEMRLANVDGASIMCLVQIAPNLKVIVMPRKKPGIYIPFLHGLGQTCILS